MSFRLYLDTADLISVADNKAPAETIASLLETCEQLQVVLVVSIWHVADLRAAPLDAAQRVVAAVDRFPSIALVQLDETGVALHRVKSFADLIKENASEIQLLNGFTTLQTTTSQSAPPPPAIAERVTNLMQRLLVTMLAADTQEEAIRRGREFLHRHRRVIPPERSEVILQGVIANSWSMREQMREHGTWNLEAIEDGLTKRDVVPAEGAHLGQHIGVLVDQRRRGQHDRGVQDGDVPDRHHCQAAPYVDVFTGDKDVCAWLDEWRSKVPYERAVRAINSNHLPHVIEALRQLAASA